MHTVISVKVCAPPSYQNEYILRVGGASGICMNKELVKNSKRRRASRL